jgi:hypothetical protein
MFNYLVSPENTGDFSLFTAITISDAILTVYFNPFREGYVKSLKFAECVRRLEKKNPNASVNRRNEKNPALIKSHSKNTAELDLPHFHREFPATISPEVLRQLLNDYKKCEIEDGFTGSQGYFPDVVIDDVVDKFKIYHSARSKGIAIESNNADYNAMRNATNKIPTILSHSYCFRNTSAIACYPKNAMVELYGSPQQIIPPMATNALASRNQAFNAAVDTLNIIGASVLIIGSIFGCIQRCRRRTKEYEQLKSLSGYAPPLTKHHRK